MLEKLFSSTWAVARHRAGVFGTYIDGYSEELASQGYAVTTLREAVERVSRFGRWLANHQLDSSDISEVTVAGFCGQDKFSHSTHRGGKRALQMMLEHLRSLGVAPPAPPPPTPSAAELLVQRFAQYLREDRSLSEATLMNYCPEAARFITGRFGTGSIDLPELCVADLHAFISRHARNYSARRVQLMLTALRAFLRFLFLRGEISSRMDYHVPRVPNWRRSELPRWLSSGDIERVLATCDLCSDVGQRDYAILILLARLGLRAGEVVSLELEDIRWETGEVSVCGKGRHRKRFPLPADVGEALAAYLKNVRRCCDSRRVFLRAKAPYQGLGGSSTLDAIVQQALFRAGLTPPLKGAHLFRHSLATKMLRRGATLTEIGQILHHTNPDTTSIYAKGDIDGLRALALPWPGDCA